MREGETLDLTSRQRLLLEAIVRAYVERAEPVGSEWLAQNQTLGVRSATIRNELADMTERGYLRQPHTSAGRIPATPGYRFFVEQLLQQGTPIPAGLQTLRLLWQIPELDVEALLAQTCRALSQSTRYTSVASPPTEPQPRVRQIHIARVSESRVLVVAVLQNGRVIHRFADLAQPLAIGDAERLGNVLDDWFRDTEPTHAALPAVMPDDLVPQEEILRSLVDVVVRSAAEGDENLFLDGTGHMLEQPEFREVEKVEPLIRLLDDRRRAYDALREMVTESRLTVVIGEESSRQEMQPCAMVAARYHVGDRLTGWVGVLGPTRMRYDETLPAVQLAADALSTLFDRFYA